MKILELLSGVQGTLIKVAAVVMIGAGLWTWGYMKGYSHEKQKLDVFKAQVSVLGKQAETEAKAKKQVQDSTTSQLRQEYEDEIASIHAYYEQHPARVRVLIPARSSSVPATPNCPTGADDAAPERGAGAEDPTPLACALDAEKLLKLQEFIRRNNFPVR